MENIGDCAAGGQTEVLQKKPTGAGKMQEKGVTTAVPPNNNNNNYALVAEKSIAKQNQSCESCCEAVSDVAPDVWPSVVEDEGGGFLKSGCGQQQITNGAAALNSYTAIGVPFTTNDEDDAFAAVGAASLTPLADDDSRSNRTSINNSTENLSYSSENYYPDDLILLDDDDVDVEAEEISLNSDDCVYAYRGDGADFDLALNPRLIARCGSRGSGDAGLADDETDFLEMDFEPDPLSEVEYGCSLEQHADAFLLQRDSCHLSGRHSSAANINTPSTSATAALQQRPLFSSPIDDLPISAVAPKAALQSQAALLNNFARISLHLDQIKGSEGGNDCVDTVPVSLLGIGMNMSVGGGGLCDIAHIAAVEATAHSLPNQLHSNFGDGITTSHVKPETKTSPLKITGAKPKRLSTFSTSSSASSKNSSKSRTSLKSAFAPALCTSSSFDERSVSCTEFRSVKTSDDVTSSGVPSCANISSVTHDNFHTLNDEACLDCLEKEFLANTIGKAMDPNECPKCRKRYAASITLYARAEQARCRSGSPSFFQEARDECIFEAPSDFLSARKREEWTSAVSLKSKIADVAVFRGSRSEEVGKMLSPTKGNVVKNVRSRRRAMCDNFSGEQKLKNILSTDQEIITISALNLNEETLVQALDKLHISYNAELVKNHFKTFSSTFNLHRTDKNFRNLKHFILHESKKNCNHHKIKRLIELATQQQVNVQFKKDTNITETEMIPVKVADILHHWTRTKNLELLKQLDKRFVDANILGKIANIIRQAQQRGTPRRPLPEFLLIPQYYASGYLTLSKKC